MMCRSPRRRRAAWFAIAPVAVALLPCPIAAQLPPPPAAAAPPLDPDSPLDEMPDIGVDWPDLNAAQEEEIAPAPDRVQAGDMLAYRVRIDGLDEAATAAIRPRFDALSALAGGGADAANVAQIDRRTREDAALLADLLRARGHYDAAVETRVVPGAQGLEVTLAAQPGPLYRFESVELRGLDGPAADRLRAAFPIAAGDPVDADKVQAALAAIRATIGAEGYPFAEIPDPEIVVDHDRGTARLLLSVASGGVKKYGRIRVAPDALFDAEHIADIARFKPGQPYEARDIEDLRRALIATGLAAAVSVRPVPGDAPDSVDIAVEIDRAPPRTIAGELGYGTGEGVRGEVSWQHRNLFPPEGGLTLRGVAGTQEFLVGALFRRNNFMRRDRVLTAQASVSRLNRKAFEADSFLVGIGIERQTNIIFQKTWTWGLGVDLLATDERDNSRVDLGSRRRTFLIAALPAMLSYDGSDDLLDPTRGFRLAGRVWPELSLQDGVFGYARAQIDASAYRPVGGRVVLAGRLRFGAIAGAAADRIAPSRRFYSGGGGSVRGYGFQAIGPRDPNNDPIGGRSLAEFALEARIRVGAFGIVPFFDGGTINRSPLPGLDDLRFGAGIGVRYHTNFGPIRVDLGTPINPAPGDPRLAIYVSLGQAF